MRKPNRVLVDSCFWIGLYDEGDSNHRQAKDEFKKIREAKIIIPWPVMYEVLKSKYVKNRKRIEKFSKDIIKYDMQYYSDNKYRMQAVERIFKNRSRDDRHISLVDHIIRGIIEDKTVMIDCLITYDYEDFNDVCKKHNVYIGYS